MIGEEHWRVILTGVLYILKPVNEWWIWKGTPKVILVSGDATLSSWWRCWYLWKPEYTKTFFFNLWIYERKSEFGTLGRAIPSYSWRCRYLRKSEYPGYQLLHICNNMQTASSLSQTMRKRYTKHSFMGHVHKYSRHPISVKGCLISAIHWISQKASFAILDKCS